ncbi:MAG: DUF3604 domain-containing protein [Chitinivibrionales bacterium]|nr:DUF3604 domain-containing protein [Chitinivibrionales bacterium]
MKEALLQHARRIATLTDTRLQLTIPSVLAEGEAFDLRLSCMGPDALPRNDFGNRLVFQDCIGVEGLPEAIALQPSDNGMYTIAGLVATGPEIVLIRARVEGTGMHGGDPVIESNPAWVFVDPPYRIYWGDIHVHTTLSNCWPWSCKDPELCYEYARDVTHLDFAAAADHLRGIASEDGRWQRLQQLVDNYDVPGGFVPLLAFESSHAKGYGGDNNVYFRDKQAPYFWPDRDDMRGYAPKVHLEELWRWLDSLQQPYMTVPHHTARVSKNRTFDEHYYCEEREPLFEIYSGWGSSETLPPNGFPLAGGNSEEQAYFTDAIRRGCRYGVIASSDDHSTLPGAQHRHRGTPLGLKTLTGTHHQGLAAVRAAELTRDSLWDAMRARHTYATTLTRTLVDMRLGDATMGDAVRVSARDRLRAMRRIELDLTVVRGREGRATVDLMRNGERIATRDITADTSAPGKTTVVFEDSEPLDQVAIRGAQHHPQPFAAYYARVQTGDMFTQWTSPIWLDL